MDRLSWGIVAAAVIGINLLFWGSSLAFFPVPWPDDSAFYLPGLDWILHGNYRMLAQSPFVPSYREANFNTMPAMPALLGIGHLLGLKSSQAIRLIGMLVLSGYAFLLIRFALAKKLSITAALLITATALLAPTIRWGSMIVRPEVWQGLFWMLLVLELNRAQPRKWWIAAWLALSAYFHFEAIIWVLPVTWALRTQNLSVWAQNLWAIAWRVLLFLSPWLFYVLTNFDLFQSQMATQFGRLGSGHPYISSVVSFFRSLFTGYGNPVGYPKFFNLGIILTWLLIFYAIFRSLKKPNYHLVAAGMAFLLWLNKPEVWFTTLFFLAFFPLLIDVLSREKKTLLKPVLSMAVLLALIQLGTHLYQWTQTRDTHSWSGYTAWVDCIEKRVEKAQVIWQPQTPDILVELAGRNPNRTYYRANDFDFLPEARKRLDRLFAEANAIIHPVHLPLGELGRFKETQYDGPPREADRYYLDEYPWFPHREYAGHRHSDKEVVICQNESFWAAITRSAE